MLTPKTTSTHADIRHSANNVDIQGLTDNVIKLFQWQLPKESSYRIEDLNRRLQEREEAFNRMCRAHDLDPVAEEFLAAQVDSPDDDEDDAHPEAASSNQAAGKGSGKGKSDKGKGKGKSDKGKDKSGGKGGSGKDSKGKGSGWANRCIALTRAYNSYNYEEFEYLANDYYLWWDLYYQEWHRYNGKGKGKGKK